MMPFDYLWVTFWVASGYYLVTFGFPLGYLLGYHLSTFWVPFGLPFGYLLGYLLGTFGGTIWLPSGNPLRATLWIPFVGVPLGRGFPVK